MTRDPDTSGGESAAGAGAPGAAEAETPSRDPLPDAPPPDRPDHAAPPRAGAEPRSAAGAGEPAAPPRRRGGRLLASLALLIALAALAGAGYLYYELIRQNDVRAALTRVDALGTELRSLDTRLDEIASEQRAALEQFRDREAAAREETERALRESLNRVARQAPPSTGEWRRAEAEYLLRIANHRLLMEHDVEGALRLLQAADTVLAELDDFALHEVRARLADEIASLESVEGTDVQGLFLRLEAAKRHLDELPLRIPEYLEQEPEAPPPAAGFWDTLKRQLAGMVEFRRLDAEVKPLLAPDEGVYLELNLRLMLERAQLAAVRREQMIFEESLATAIDWIHEYLNTDEPAVRRLLAELNEMQGVQLAQPLPDISGSLNALKQVLRNPA